MATRKTKTVVEGVKEQPIVENKEEKAEEVKTEEVCAQVDAKMVAQNDEKREEQAAVEKESSQPEEIKEENQANENADCKDCDCQKEEGEFKLNAERFKAIANLLNTSLEEINQEYFLNQVYKLMSKIGKVIVRYNLAESEIEKIFLNCNKFKFDGITVSPAYFSVCKRIKTKNKLQNVKLCSIIDFPFGESLSKAKIASVREGRLYGAFDATIMMPAMLLSQENIKIFKSQCKKFARFGGIALNAFDLNENTLQRAVMVTNKTKISHLTFVFGEATMDEVKEKLLLINKYKGNKKTCVFANVENAKTASELFALGVDKILTPYADLIGMELFEKFDLNNGQLR